MKIEYLNSSWLGRWGLAGLVLPRGAQRCVMWATSTQLSWSASR